MSQEACTPTPAMSVLLMLREMAELPLEAQPAKVLGGPFGIRFNLSDDAAEIPMWGENDAAAWKTDLNLPAHLPKNGDFWLFIHGYRVLLQDSMQELTTVSAPDQLAALNGGFWSTEPAGAVPRKFSLAEFRNVIHGSAGVDGTTPPDNSVTYFDSASGNKEYGQDWDFIRAIYVKTDAGVISRPATTSEHPVVIKLHGFATNSAIGNRLVKLLGSRAWANAILHGTWRQVLREHARGELAQ